MDALLEGALAGGAAVVLTSDHGNLEDLSRKTHTRARVPLAVAGLPLPTAAEVPDIAAGGRWLAERLGSAEAAT